MTYAFQRIIVRRMSDHKTSEQIMSRALAIIVVGCGLTVLALLGGVIWLAWSWLT